MKIIKYILFGAFILFTAASCNNYLDVNTDPDNPTSENAAIKERLPWIENYYTYAWGCASMRACTIAGTAHPNIHRQQRRSLGCMESDSGRLCHCLSEHLPGCRSEYRPYDQPGKGRECLFL
jgi:hypothetical protein